MDPYRIERIYKTLQGRDKLTPQDMLAVQTDIYSEVDQEIGHRLAYAIDHTPSADDRLRKAADLMRSWDGRLTTDSAAASLVTKARSAFWPMILKPKLGKDAKITAGPSPTLPRKRSSCTAARTGFRPTYKNWDALLTDLAARA
jgi:penicillin amidase